jgi:hypothetical protein
MPPKDVREHVELVKQALAKARLEYQSRKGRDVEVSMQIES